MKKLLLLLALLLLLTSCQKPIITIKLDDKINETSGLELVDKELITFNDSGGKSELYYLNNFGKIIYERKVRGKNTDWEDITKDSTHIFIGDIGNNYDNRTNLNIIKIPIHKDSITSEIIKFRYPEQTQFSTIYDSSQYDAEGLISYGDSLLIFTKNKLKKVTEIYRLPKIGGDYEAELVGVIDTKLIITSADYDETNKLLVMTGTVNFNDYHLIVIEDFVLNKSFSIKTYTISVGKSQIEAIKILDSTTFWITSEDEGSVDAARLFKFYL
jgi:hypothetical protein